MKKLWIFCMLLAASTTLAAQVPPVKAAIVDDEDYSKAMKEVAAQNGALRKSLASSSNVDATAAAERLEAIFKNVQAYWENRKAEDAITAAKTAVAASQAISKAVAVHDAATATTASQTLAGTCTSCHAAHRDRLTADFYKIK